MMKYWPNKQGINLNQAVINILNDTNNKFVNHLNNQTTYYLYIDILDTYNKHKLIQIIIQELKFLLLDLTELNLPRNTIINMKSKILIDLQEQCVAKFIAKKDFSCNNNSIYNNKYLQHMYLQQQLLIEYILIYFLFGASFISYYTFTFNNLYTPYEHVQILLENFIIQLSNLIIYHLIEAINEFNDIYNILNKYKLCNTNYLSTRSIAIFKNNLKLQNIKEFYINQPKEIYNSKYKVFLISSHGIICKYIFISRINDLQKLSKVQLFLLLFLEIQDLVIPRIENTLLIVVKIIFYTLINLLGNSLLIIIRILINQIKSNK